MLQELKGMQQDDIQEYLKTNFEKMWDEHDVQNTKIIDVTEAYNLFRELWFI